MKGTALAEDATREMEARAMEMVRQAGQIALRHFRRPLQVEYKQGRRSDPVTEADREIEGYLRSTIAEQFPDHGVLGEEGSEVEAVQREFLWVLDPLDGTTNFLNGLPLFSCSAGLLYHGRPVAGALFLPVAPRPAGGVTSIGGGDGSDGRQLQLEGAVLHARLGGGAYLEGDRVYCSTEPYPEASSLSGLPGFHSYQFERLGRFLRNPGEPRSLGSVCYEMAMVACGVFRFAVFRSPKIWDVAAGTLIVQEAGGSSLVWQRDRWDPLLQFEPMENRGKGGGRGMRYWSRAMMVGGSPVSAHLSQRLRPMPSLKKRLRELLLGRSTR